MRFIKLMAGAVVAVLLAGCAGTGGSQTITSTFNESKLPKRVSVSPVMYETLDCDEIKREAATLAARTQKVSGFRNVKAGGSATIIWPAGLTINPNSDDNVKLVRIRHQFEALEKASFRENCNLRFQRGVNAEGPEQKSAQSGWETKVS